MYGWSGPIPDAVPDAPKPPWDGIPRACIRQRDGKAHCGRDIDEKREFVFTDPDRARTAYKNDKHLRACENCVARLDDADDQHTTDLRPMSTRGIPNAT